MQRPTGVTILAVLTFVIALDILVSGLLLLGRGSFLPQFSVWVLALFTMIASCGSHALGALALVLQVAPNLLPGIFFMMALLYAIIGVGLLKIQNWARWLVIVLAIFELATTAIGYAIPRFLLFRQNLIGVAIDVAFLIFLFQPKTKETFGAGAV
jgi:hypothetical protein